LLNQQVAVERVGRERFEFMLLWNKPPMAPMLVGIRSEDGMPDTNEYIDWLKGAGDRGRKRQ
jgi:hypothetical protein